MDLREVPVYVINLDRRPDRWATFSTQPALSFFKKVERFSAVDGSKLDIQKDSRVSVHTRWNIRDKYRRSHYEINTPGAIGASLSHIGIWQKLVDSEDSHCIVFEDDTVVTEQMLLKAQDLVKVMPKADIWLLGHHRWSMESVPMSSDPKGWRRVNSFTGAHAYLIHRSAAQHLLTQCFPIETHIEYYISGMSKVGDGFRIVRKADFRVPYSIEFTDGDDSDTFDTVKSCPVCFIPDNYKQTFVAMPKEKFYRAVGGVAALGFVGLGLLLAMREGRKN